MVGLPHFFTENFSVQCLEQCLSLIVNIISSLYRIFSIYYHFVNLLIRISY